MKIYTNKSKFGKGVFAKQTIKKGELICIMQGKRLEANQLGEIAKKGRKILVDPLQIGKEVFLDLDSPYLYFNHSCNPNAGIKNNIELIAIKDIARDEEIYFDYSTTWFDGFICECGNMNCRTYIADYYSIPKHVRKKYKKLGVVSTFIKDEL